MNIASVIVDIPTQALDTPYSYAVPDEMLVGEGGRPAAVGCAVLVTLGGRKAVGYIVGLEEVVPSPDEGTDLWGTPQSAADLKQVEAVLSAPFFDEEGAACALWLADRYIVDIPTQALDTPYSYAVPDEMLVGEGGRPAAVGCAVLVTLGGRKAVGYIVGLEEVVPSPDEGTDLWGTPQSAADLKQVEAVLSAPFFDEEGAACALWLADRYAAPLAECVRLFTPPRAVPRIVRGRDGRWRIEEPAIGEVDDRWVTRGPAFDAFVPRKNAVKQQEVLAAVDAGDVRVAELSREFGAVGSTLKALAAKGAVVVARRRRMRGLAEGASRAGAPAGGAAAPAPSAAPQLTEGQKAAVAAIEAARAAGDGRVVLSSPRAKRLPSPPSRPPGPRATGVWCSWTASPVPARPRCTCRPSSARFPRGAAPSCSCRKSRSPLRPSPVSAAASATPWPSCTPA